MLDFIIWTSIILTVLCAGVFLVLIGLILLSIIQHWKSKASLKVALPPPDKASERMYGQQYFDRAMKK